MTDKKVLVIGAGPAGMMAAIIASKNGAKVTVIEKNKRVGRKIMITGKGRCNVTNNCDVKDFISNVPTNNRFLYSAINSFTPSDAIEFFEDNGLKLKTERGNRVFPVSDKAVDVVDTFKRLLEENKCKVIYKSVKSFKSEDNKIISVKTIDNMEYFADSFILATGGMSYPITGSSGDGYKFAKSLGHTIIKPKASLVPIECKENFCKQLQGLSLRNVKIRVLDENKNKQIFTDFGEMMFTHFGVTGPLILSASAHLKDIETTNYSIYIDLKPALDIAQLEKRIQRDFDKNLNKDFSNSLGELFPKSLIPVIIKLCNIAENTKCNQITKEQRFEFATLIKNLKISATKFRPIEEAIITCGGVNVLEINPKTMCSKIIDNLFFAGEIIDVDAYTGGFNLQIAYSTGYVAGEYSSY